MGVDELQRILSDPKTYGCSDVKVIQTATSMVFLTGKHAYKTNRDVKLSFLDYSTKQNRMDFARKEFEMNKKMSPQLYLNLLKVADGKLVEDHGIPDAAAEGIVIKMAQMDPESSMDNALAKGRVTREHVKELAQALAQFHGATTNEPEFGTVEAILFSWNELFGHVEGGREGFITAEQVDVLRSRVLDFIKYNKTHFDRRVSDGKIRFCHGDFHSGNVFLGDQVILFDRITFNKRFPCSDVMSEVAFMAMDLEFHGRNDLAKIFVDEYISKTGDTEGMRLLDFYTCFRAWIRGCINFFNGDAAGKKYFDLAIAYSKKL